MNTLNNNARTAATLILGVGLCASSAAIAQPAASFLGAIGDGVNTFQFGHPDASIGWFRIQVIAPTSFSRFYDFRAAGATDPDVELAIFNASGTLIAQNDDWDTTSRKAGLSFGQSYPRRRHNYPTGTQLGSRSFAGQDGALPAGTYYCCVANYNAVFSSPFGATSNNGAVTQVELDVWTNDIVPSAPLISGYPQLATLRPGNATVLRTLVTAGTVPDSLGLTATVDCSSIGGGAVVPLNDAGIDGDEAINDDFWSVGVTLPFNLPSGAYSLPLSVRDLQGRQSTGSLTMYIDPGINITPVPPSGLVNVGDTVLFRARVTPGVDPVSTGVRVLADLSAFGAGPASQMFDDGTHGDEIAGDNIYSVSQIIPFTTVAGTYDMTTIVTDDQGRSQVNEGLGLITVARQPNLPEASYRNSNIAVAENLNPGEVLWYNFNLPQGANATHYLDINTLANSITDHDTMIGLFDAAGNLVGSNDDWDLSAAVPNNRASMLTYGMASSPRHYAPFTADADGRTGASLPPGVYYLAVTGYNAAFSQNFRVITSHTRSGVARFNIYTGSNCSLADLVDGGGSLPADGIVDGSDFVAFINSFGVGDPMVSPLADINGDSIIDGADFIEFINAFSEGC